MDGIHDMGGMDGFGSVVVEPNEAVFHQRWESRVLAMNRAMGASGTWNIDVARYGIELLPPQVYLTSSYYERWFLRLERLLVQHGLVDTDEIAAGQFLRSRYLQNDARLPQSFVVGSLRRSRPGFNRRTRLILTIDRDLHEGAIRHGVTAEEIKEILIHVTAYCGRPEGRHSFLAAHEALTEAGALP